jgi:hypothetical protein
MIQYIKLILEKVSFDRYLFEKELRKALKSVVPDELIEFKNYFLLPQHRHIIFKRRIQ